MEDVLLLTKAYRRFLLELGEAFKRLREEEGFIGYADTFIDAIKSPEVGFTNAEVQSLIKMYDKFGALDIDDLPSHHIMKLMINKRVDMNLLESAKTLNVNDFKELVKDEETGTQERTYRYEVVKRCNETGNIKRVFQEELPEAVAVLQNQIVNN